MNVILLGAPGAGKGTQAINIAEQTGLTHVSSGDLFRAALRDGTELGQKAKAFMDRGDLVPDNIVIDMIMERIGAPDCAKGVIFDGFPRTVDQALALSDVLQRNNQAIDAVLYLSVDQEILLKRISGRVTCKNCGAVYNIYFTPTSQPGICDRCGSDQLYQRSDDNEETARNRLDVYFHQTTPLIDHYREQGTLHEIDGQGDIAQITHAMVQAIGANSGH
ncbi:MAG: adenylate kinase [Chloroflexaceae bacterium]|nr:adenylate kinase [Chloroflexaceae bacterium]